MIAVLTGGTGGAKLVQGLARILPPEELVVIVNTGDDLAWWGLNVSPDLDTVTYALSGRLSAERGWGVEGDTFRCRDAMALLGAPVWFNLGDDDLATHLVRTQSLAEGRSLSQATEHIARTLGIGSRILPMSDSRVETRIATPQGEVGFQEYFVRDRFQPVVDGVRFAGAERALPAPGVIEAIESAAAVLLAPSNPITSIGPILAVPGIREALVRTRAPVAAVSPIVGGAAVSGPAGSLMRSQGLPVSVEGLMQYYAGFLDLLVVDPSDAPAAGRKERPRVRLHGANIMMRSESDKVELAREVVAAAEPLVIG
jgi:LPPG:FO 2-phospho-L-lactate transferase